MAITFDTILTASALSDELADLAHRVKPSVTTIGQNGGNGAGVIWRADGQIVTNHHVVSRDHNVTVRLADGRRLQGEVTARHPSRDLALIEVDADDLPTIDVGDSSTVRPGQIAFAIGHPFGLRDAVTAGIVVATGQAATGEGPRTGDHLQTDVRIAPGNSGGPLVDAHGRVIGINSMVAGRLALSIPSLSVEHFVAGQGAGSATAYIGVGGTIVVLRRPDVQAGFLLTDVHDGSPADTAGLLVGDVIVRLGERQIIDQESVPAAMLRWPPGVAMPIDLLRGGEPRSFVVVPTERPDSPADD